MKQYIKPSLEILIFDEEEVFTSSYNYTYAAYELNKYMFNEGDAAGTTTVTAEKIKRKQ